MPEQVQSPAPPCARRHNAKLAGCLHAPVRIIGKQLFDAVAGANLSDDHANSDAHTPDAGLAAHDKRILSNAI